MGYDSTIMAKIGKNALDTPFKTAQGKRFIEKARELGCDEDEAAFEKRLRKIAKAPPKVEGSKAVHSRKRGK